MRPDALERRDPEFIREVLPAFLFLARRYHHTTITGLKNVPDGPALMVGNHNGGYLVPDMFAFMAEYWDRFGVQSPSYGLMHDFLFGVPALGTLMAKVGAVPADPQNAATLLGRGARVLVYPGGDIDAYKPYARRHEVVFGERTGFVRVALRAGVPIVPLVSCGAHEALHVFTDGRALARRTHFKRVMRVEVLPVAFSLPFGLSFGPAFLYLPAPVRMKLRVLPPIHFDGLGPEDAKDPAVLRRCQEQVRGVMQRALDEMVAEGGCGRRKLTDVLRGR